MIRDAYVIVKLLCYKEIVTRHVIREQGHENESITNRLEGANTTNATTCVITNETSRAS